MTAFVRRDGYSLDSRQGPVWDGSDATHELTARVIAGINVLRRTCHYDGAVTLPVDQEISALAVDSHWSLNKTVKPRRHRCRAGSSATTPGFSRPSFPNSEINMTPVLNLRPKHARALREYGVVLNGWAKV